MNIVYQITRDPPQASVAYATHTVTLMVAPPDKDRLVVWLAENSYEVEKILPPVIPGHARPQLGCEMFILRFQPSYARYRTKEFLQPWYRMITALNAV